MDNSSAWHVSVDHSVTTPRPDRAQVQYPISEGAESARLSDEARSYFGHRTDHMKKQYRSYGFLDWAAVLLPCIAWLRTYNIRRNLVVRLLIREPPCPSLDP